MVPPGAPPALSKTTRPRRRGRKEDDAEDEDLSEEAGMQGGGLYHGPLHLQQERHLFHVPAEDPSRRAPLRL